MKQITVGGNICFLLDDTIQWAASFKLSAAIDTMQEVGLSGLESRRPLGATLRLSAAYTILLQGMAAVTNFRNQLQQLNTQLVICPLWCCQIEAGVTPTVTANYYVVLDSSFNATLQPASAAPFSGLAYPAMFGRLQESADPMMITDDNAEVDIKFIENDASYISLPAFSAPLSFNAGVGSFPVLPFEADWATDPKAGRSDVEMQRVDIGQSRSTSDAYYAQKPRRKVQSSYTFSGQSWVNLLSMFLACGGDATGFWLPAVISDVALASNVASGANTLTVLDASNIGTETFILLDDQNTRTASKITNVTGNVLTISPAAAAAYQASNTRVESLIFARFDKPTLEIEFTADTTSKFTGVFTEIPWETAAVTGETIGTTFGTLPTTAILLTFSMQLPDGSFEYWYFTSFESILTNSGVTYVSQPFEIGSITETSVIERQNATLKSRNFSGNPLAKFIPFSAEMPLMLVVVEADVTGSTATNLRTLFQGEITKVDSDGPYLNATASSLKSWFDRKIPRRLVNNGCNWILFESKCGLSKSAWTWTGTVSAVSGTVLTLASVSSSNSATLAAHFFAGGFLEVGTGTSVQYRMISDSTAVSGGNIQISLASPFTVAPGTGVTVTLFPGCDGISTTCINKFNNYANFGGFPFVPAVNPSTFQQTLPASGGTKK